jgi:hypothetical protein
VPKPMLRERGDNDRQAIAHHKGGRGPSDKCALIAMSVDEIGRPRYSTSGNGTFGPEAYATRSPSGHDLKTRSRPPLTDERPSGVGRPFGELENDRGLTREIVPAYYDGSLSTVRTRNAEAGISFRATGDGTRLFLSKVNQRQAAIFV